MADQFFSFLFFNWVCLIPVKENADNPYYIYKNKKHSAVFSFKVKRFYSTSKIAALLFISLL